MSPLPRRVNEVRGLGLHLVEGWEDPWSGLWNELIAQEHPLGDAPLVGWPLRYLIGWEHGWLGAIGLGPPAWHWAPRDQWIGWSQSARTAHLPQVIGRSRLLIRRGVHWANLASPSLARVMERVAQDWQGRYGHRPWWVESLVDRSHSWGPCYRSANGRLIGVSQGRGRDDRQRLYAAGPKDIYV